MAAIDRLAPPVVGKVTDTTIQLYWNAVAGPARYCIQEFDTAKSSERFGCSAHDSADADTQAIGAMCSRV